MAPADFFLSKKLKWGLAGQSLYQDSIKNAWEGVAMSLIALDFTAEFRSWLKQFRGTWYARLGGCGTVLRCRSPW